MAVVLATFFLVAPVVEKILPAKADLDLVVFVTVSVLAAVTAAVAAVLSRGGSETRRGFVLGMVFGAALALIYNAVPLVADAA